MAIEYESPGCYYRDCGIGQAVTFSLHPLPSAAFPEIPYDPGYEVQPCDTVEWDFGDGTPKVTTHGTETVQHTFDTVADRIVTAVVTNSLGYATTDTGIDIDDVIRIALGQTIAYENTAVAMLPVRRIGGLARTASLRLVAGHDSEFASVPPFSKVVSFGPGETETTVAIPIANDAAYRGLRGETVYPRDAVGAIGVSNGLIEIREDDPQPVLSFDDVHMMEGDAGITEVQMVARISGPLADGHFFFVDVDHPVDLTSNPKDWPVQTATRYEDFEPDMIPVIFDRGQLTASVKLSVKGDRTAENDELIVLGVQQMRFDSDPVYLRRFATVTIIDDDRASLRVDPSSLVLRAGEHATFQISIEPPRPEPHQVSLAWTGTGEVQFPSTVMIAPGASAEVTLETTTAGDGTLVMSAPDLQSATSLAVTITEALSLEEIAPALGPITGGTTVAIQGSGFDSQCQVAFGGAPAAIVSVTPESIVVAAPPHDAGSVDVTVTCGGRSATIAEGFVYKRGRRRAAAS